MKIGITLYPYGENSPAGLARYIFDLTKALVENDPNNEYIIFLKENPKNRPVFQGIIGKYMFLDTGLLAFRWVLVCPKSGCLYI